jgi:hypothetical protein
MKFWLVIFILLILTMETRAVSNRSKELSRLFFNTVADLNKIDLAMAKKLLSQFKDDDAIHGNVGGTVPVLHHLLNLHRLSSLPRDQMDIIELMLSCLKFGADPEVGYKNDPPLLFKAIMIKELHLVKSIIDANPKVISNLLQGSDRWSSQFFVFLYSTPSESVPLAKLLLHVDTIAASKGLEAMGGVDGIKKLLASASLGKPSVKSADLVLHSVTYNNTVLTSLGNRASKNTGRILLMDIIHSLDELAGAIHSALLQSVVNLFKDGDEPDLSLVERLLQVLTADRASVEAGSAFSMKRNALHYLCLSGGASMLKQLGSFVSQVKDSGASVSEEDHVQLQGQIHASISLMKGALGAIDSRGHTPVTYALMRFSKSSPVVASLRELCGAVDFDFEAAALSYTEKVRSLTIGSTVDLQASEGQSFAAVSEDGGGWTPQGPGGAGVPGPLSAVIRDILSTKASSEEATKSAWNDMSDVRVLEVLADELPTNKEFFLKYINTGTPVVFRKTQQERCSGVSDKQVPVSTSMTELRARFQKDAFLARYGSVAVPSSTIPYAGIHIYGLVRFSSTFYDIHCSM